MIQHPPFDAVLSELSSLVDEDAMTSLVAAVLETSGQVEVVGCRPRYVRYKPGTSCLVQYTLTTSDATGEAVTFDMHIKLYLDDRAKRRATSSKMKRLLRRASQLHGELPFERTAYIPEIDGLLQVYPIDYDLKYLVRASSQAEMTEVFRKTRPELNALTVTATPELLRYKPERKALLRYSLGNAPVERLYGKLQSQSRTALLISQTNALIEAGVATPPIRCSRSRHGFVAQEEAAGVQLASLRGAADFIAWMEPLAQALHRMQSVAVPSTTHTLADEAGVVTIGIELLKRVVPHLATRLDRVKREITSRLTQMDEQLATIHGDFYDDQALVSDAGVTIIDLDEMRRGHPLLDVGNMLAHLTAGESRGEAVGPARDAFLAASQRHGSYSDADIAVFEAAALMRLAPGPFRRLEPDWPEAIQRVVALAEQSLMRFEAGKRTIVSSEAHPSCRPVEPSGVGAFLAVAAQGQAGNDTGPRGATVDDAALPQLTQLRDPITMAMEFRTALDAKPVTVNAIRLMRHKPGRRCLLRYDLQIGDPPSAHRERFYGKTFASERGPGVYDIAHRIVDAHVFGTRVTVPAPVAYLPNLKLLIQREVPGEPIMGRLLAGDTSLAAHIAEALHTLHASGVDLGRRHDLAMEIDPLQDRAEQISTACPDLSTAARRCLALVQAGRRRVMDWRWRAVHRDCYHEQFLAGPHGLSLLDLDDAAMSEPALDIANFIAHLRLLGLQECRDSSPLFSVAASFAATARELDAGLDPELLRFLEGATLLRLAAIHLPRERDSWLASRLLEEAERLLTPSQ